LQDKLFTCQKPKNKNRQPQYPLQLPIRFWLTNLGEFNRPIREFLFFLEGDPINFGLSLGQLGQLLPDGVLLLQVIN
jgi:hypothetical protein